MVSLCKPAGKVHDAGFSVKVLLTDIIHLWVKRDVNSISRFFFGKKVDGSVA